MEASSHGSALHRLDRVRFDALVFTNLEPGSPRLPRRHGGLLPGEAPAVLAAAPPAAVNVGDEYGRRLACASCRTRSRSGSPTTPSSGPSALDGDRPQAARALQRRERARRDRGGAAARHRRRRDRARARVDARRAGAVRGDRRGAAVRGDRRLRAHAGRARERCCRRRASSRRGRVICVFGAGGDRDRGKRPHDGAVASERADVVIVTSDNPRSEDPQAIIEEIVAGRRGDVEVEPDRARGDRARDRARAARRRGVIAGKGDEQGQEIADRAPFDDREMAREALREAGGAHVIPLPLDEIAALGRLESATPSRASPASRSTRAASRRATCSSRSAAATRSSTTRARAARRRRSSPTTGWPRSRRSAAPCARGATRASSRSSARWGRRRRRTSSPRSCGRTCALVAAEDGPQQRDRAAADALQARARHRGRRHRDGHARARPDRVRSREIARPDVGVDHVDRPGAPRARRHRRERRARQGRAARGAARRRRRRRAGRRAGAEPYLPARHRDPALRPARRRGARRSCGRSLRRARSRFSFTARHRPRTPSPHSRCTTRSASRCPDGVDAITLSRWRSRRALPGGGFVVNDA